MTPTTQAREGNGRPELNADLIRDIVSGLSSSPKKIPSKYFYDETGDELFCQITRLPEYYLTSAEKEIIEASKDELLTAIDASEGLNVIELGAGNGSKTKVILSHFLAKSTKLVYSPVDISRNALLKLKAGLAIDIPQLKVQCHHGDYIRALRGIARTQGMKRLILFLGSSIGNFTLPDAEDFLCRLSAHVAPGDHVLIGFDLKKHPKVILGAYNDSAGITRKFNLNLLERINRELGADFSTAQFDHLPTYDPSTGEARSYLVSNCTQKVHISALDASFHFQEGEVIYTEVSRKYSMEEITALANKCGFRVTHNFFDSKRYFVNTLWTPS